VIGVDTNVLVRLAVSDSPEQGAAARVLIEEAETGGQKVFVNRIVLAEFLWVLASQYGVTKADALSAVEALARHPALQMEDRDAVLQAVAAARQGRQQLTDLIVAATNADRGCSTTYTFDRIAARVEHFTLLE
jgi:predicted nucleic-acid-binding protein